MTIRGRDWVRQMAASRCAGRMQLLAVQVDERVRIHEQVTSFLSSDSPNMSTLARLAEGEPMCRQLIAWQAAGQHRWGKQHLIQVLLVLLLSVLSIITHVCICVYISLSLSIYIYIYIYVYMCIYIYIYI